MDRLENKQVASIHFDPFDTNLMGAGIPNYMADPKKYPVSLPIENVQCSSLATPEQIAAMNKVYAENPHLQQIKRNPIEDGLTTGYNFNDAWIQTYTGRRFTPLNPNPNAIVIEDIAHALSNICRFTGHCHSFYSVAQHCVLVSYICNQENALYGLLHDAPEAYCQDISSPIKRTEIFTAYRAMEDKLQQAICQRFNLPKEEPRDVKKADLMLLSTEARDLLLYHRSDWSLDVHPLPFKIIPLQPNEAKKLFLERFEELTK